MARKSDAGREIVEDFLKQKDANVASLVCTVLFALVPPRSFIAVTGDIINIVVLGSVLTVPIFTLLVTDKSTEKMMRANGDYVAGGLRRFIAIIGFMSVSIAMLVVSKMLITWFGYHHWFAIVDRTLAGITGFSVGLFLASLSAGLSALGALADRPDDPLIDNKSTVT